MLWAVSTVSIKIKASDLNADHRQSQEPSLQSYQIPLITVRTENDYEPRTGF